MIENKKVGLSLSGGGYRAAAFHLGTLKKLHELQVLEKVDIMSTISGGSITGAAYCLYKEGPENFDANMREALATKNVIRSVFVSFTFVKTVLFVLIFLVPAVWVLFTAYAWLSIFILVLMIYLLIRYQYSIFPVGKEIEKAYDAFFYKKAALCDLCDKPEIAIGSTNLQTARQFTFSKRKMEDSVYAYRVDPVKFKNACFPVARAVFASSCVPFAFTPVKIGRQFFVNPEDAKKVDPTLVDGGVYDNQGIHKLTQPGSSYECQVIVTSDAGDKLPFAGSYNNAVILLIRTMDVFMARIKNFQMIQNLYNNTNAANKEIAYLSLGWDVKNCIPGFIDNLAAKKIPAVVVELHHIPQAWVDDVGANRANIQGLLETNVGYAEIVKQDLTPHQLAIARGVGTNLTPLSSEQIDLLAKHAYNLTGLQVKLYCPSLTATA